ncbi:MAG: hypothetical protein K9L66_09035 [Spirochaetaceae bacterium]|nr:hypothetical protein [Spirochaetaceae bacterium]MCF7947838.1 hypothetical protein [Spirochaetia bacterium]MCF7951646.1 hypothetical protein [Spirochaetaceae bacterium]
MGEIKSTWELAMERTADIKSDKTAVRKNELKKIGQKIASDYMNSDTPEPKNLQKAIKEYKGDERNTVESSAVEILLSHISLPRDENFQERLNYVEKGLKALIGKDSQLSSVLQQVSQFFTQYLQHREQLTEQVKQQYEPQLRQKQQNLTRQYGYEIELKPEQDPEYTQLLQRHMQQLEQQYQNALNEVKDQIRSFYDE